MKMVNLKQRNAEKNDSVNFEQISEVTLLISFGRRMDSHVSDIIQSVVKNLTQKKNSWLWEIVPSFTTILIRFDPVQINYFEVSTILKKLIVNQTGIKEKKPKKIVNIPVCYSPNIAPDILKVSKQCS